MNRLLIPFLLVAVFFILLVILILWAKPVQYEKVSKLPIDTIPTAITKKFDGSSLKIMTYNIHYGVGPSDDIGKRQSPQNVKKYITQIGQFIREKNIDIVCLQEIDFGSQRSAYLDQIHEIAHKVSFSYVAVSPVWEANHIPHPLTPLNQHIGKVKSAIAIMSKYPITSHTRYILPKPEENPFWYNWFYLDRAIQHVTITLEEHKNIEVFNLHFEAFKSKTRQTHANQLISLVSSSHADFICGDFNSLPPEAIQQHAFPDEPEQDYRNDETMKNIFQSLTSFQDVILSQPLKPSPLSYPSSSPNRRLDYILFNTKTTHVNSASIDSSITASDHLPIVAEIVIH